MKVIEFRTDYRSQALVNAPEPLVDGPGEVLQGTEQHDAILADHAFVRPAEPRRSRSIGAWILLGFLRFYIVCFSPVLGGACKFYPSCSNYAVEAVTKHGARQGFVLAAKRLMRCRPFTKGGFDPVPDDLPHTKTRRPNGKLQVVSGSEMKLRATERRML